MIGAQEGIQGNIQINALGGTVTRRIIAGTYNNRSLGWTSNNIVTGTATVVIGNNLEGFGDRQYGRGIFGGSRTDKNETAEIGTLIFTGGAYEKFKDSVSVKRGAMDVGISNHDYLVDVSANGAVVPNAAGTVEITANDGYYTIANGTETANGEFKLSDGYNKIEFADANIPRINGLSVDGNKATVTYRGVPSEGAVVVAALYYSTGKTLLDVACVPAKTESGAQSSELTFKYTMENGKQYTVSAMLWSGIDSITPLCGKVSANLTPGN